nr:solute carrier family 35 member G1 isoform X2 [Microcebus murinus]
MRPEDGAGAAEPGEPVLLLTDDAPPGASEEPAAAGTEGAPGRGRCWLCPASPCGSRAEPGNPHEEPLILFSPLPPQARKPVRPGKFFPAVSEHIGTEQNSGDTGTRDRMKTASSKAVSSAVHLGRGEDL